MGPGRYGQRGYSYRPGATTDRRYVARSDRRQRSLHLRGGFVGAELVLLRRRHAAADAGLCLAERRALSRDPHVCLGADDDLFSGVGANVDGTVTWGGTPRTHN